MGLPFTSSNASSFADFPSSLLLVQDPSRRSSVNSGITSSSKPCRPFSARPSRSEQSKLYVRSPLSLLFFELELELNRSLPFAVLTSGWNDSGWLCGGHAVRLGMDIGCTEAFYQLLATGMGAGKTGDELEADRVLVSKARVGFVLFNFDNQVSFIFFSLSSSWYEIELT